MKNPIALTRQWIQTLGELERFVDGPLAPHGENASIVMLSNEEQQDKNLHAHYLIEGGLDPLTEPGAIDYLCTACSSDVPIECRSDFIKS